MTRRLSDHKAIEAETDRIRSLGLDELRTLWRATLRSPPPAFTKDLVARFTVSLSADNRVWKPSLMRSTSIASVVIL